MNILTIKPRPLVSVCMPTYRGTKYVKAAIDSLASQAITDYELVICDDDPVWDNTGVYALMIAQEHGISAKRITNKERLGIAGSLNKAINYSKGRWIKPLFQDDVLNDNCLVSMLDAAKDDVFRLVVAKREFIGDGVKEQTLEFVEKNAIDYNFINYQPICSREFSEHIKWRLWTNFVGEPTSVMFSRKLYKYLGGFDNKFVQLLDWDFWCRVATNYGLWYIPEALSLFRIHQEGASTVNVETNKYQTTVIDPLYLLSKMCNLAVYNKFRSIVGKEYLTGLLIKTIKFARDIAETQQEIETFTKLLKDNYYIYSLALMVGVNNESSRRKSDPNRMPN